MVDYDLIVGRQPQVALNPGAKLQRGGKGKQAVFRKVGAAMQPAMREALRPRPKGIRPSGVSP
jgi:hypothetical protein